MNATMTQIQAGTAKGLNAELLRIGDEALMRTDGVYVRVKVLDCKRAWGNTRFEVAPVGGVGALWVDSGRLSPASSKVDAPVGRHPAALPAATVQDVINLIERVREDAATSDAGDDDCATALRLLREMKQDAEAVEGGVTRAELVDALAKLAWAVTGTTCVLKASLPDAAENIRAARDKAMVLLARIPAAERAR